MSVPRQVLSLVIPSRPDSHTLSACLRAVAQQTLKPDEVLVIRDHALRGPSWARNQGIARARGDLIAFLDDDCLPPAHWLQHLVDAMMRHAANGAGGNYLETDPFLDEIRKSPVAWMKRCKRGIQETRRQNPCTRITFHSIRATHFDMDNYETLNIWKQTLFSMR